MILLLLSFRLFAVSVGVGFVVGAVLTSVESSLAISPEAEIESSSTRGSTFTTEPPMDAVMSVSISSTPTGVSAAS